jgi:hypothetical protein
MILLISPSWVASGAWRNHEFSFRPSLVFPHKTASFRLPHLLKAEDHTLTYLCILRLHERQRYSPSWDGSLLGAQKWLPEDNELSSRRAWQVLLSYWSTQSYHSRTALGKPPLSVQTQVSQPQRCWQWGWIILCRGCPGRLGHLAASLASTPKIPVAGLQL